MQHILQIQNVSKTYKTDHRIVNALDKVNLTIQKGEIFALLGVNGAGKTTLSSIIATLHPATSGDVLFNGVSIYKNLMGYRKALEFAPKSKTSIHS